jgi:GNAT superfamily N-acetyltransferase
MHLEHDAVAAALRAAYEEPYEPMGWATERRRYGIFRRNTKAETYPSVIVRDLAPAGIPGFLKDVRHYYAGSPFPVRIMIDDRGLDAVFGPSFERTGLRLDERTTFLAHVGEPPEERDAPGVRIEEVARGGIYEYEDTRRKGFADSDATLEPDEIEAGVRLRLAEMDGGAHYWLARADGQPAAAMGWYDSEDRLVFSLSTRVPFRNRGIARRMLTRLLHESRAACTRAVIINANEDGTPVRLYRRLGFTDEVYWRATYEMGLRQ